jgi:8-oxo-dGTP diphosphatase
MPKSNVAESAFLQTYDPNQFDRPSVSVDVVVLSPRNGQLWTVMVRRSDYPFKGKWALPGSFVAMNESLDDAAARALADKAGVRDIFLEQLYTFGAVRRDPRMRIISVAYFALVDFGHLMPRINAESMLTSIEVPWTGEDGGAVILSNAEGERLKVAFDHDAIIGMAVQRIRGKLHYTGIAFELLPNEFTLSDVQRIHETILGKRLNKDSFRRSLLATGLIEVTGSMQSDVGHRPAALFRRRSAGGAG